MRSPSTFQRDARNAYERGRFRAALRVGALIIPLSAVAARESGQIAGTAVLGIALCIVSILVRWRMPEGFATVATGLRSGAVPFLAALALCRLAPSCPPLLAAALCGTTGLSAGVVLGRSLTWSPGAPWTRWSAAALVAGLMATLGCMALGIGSAIGAAVGIGLGSVVALALPSSQRL